MCRREILGCDMTGWKKCLMMHPGLAKPQKSALNINAINRKKKQIPSHRKWNGGLVTLRRLTDSWLVGFFFLSLSLSALHVWMFIRKHEWRPSVDSLNLFGGGVKNENCNMGIMFRFVAKGSDIDENYVNTSISNNEGGKKWRYIHQSSLKKKLKGFQVLMGILEYKNMIDVRGYIVKRNSSLMICNYFSFFFTFRLESLMGLDRSHIEDETLRHSSWYQAGIPR